MGNDKKTYLIDGEPVDVESADINDFVKEYPQAVEAKTFIVGKDTFDVAISDLPDFQKEYPKAKPLYEEITTQKKKSIGNALPTGGKVGAFETPSTGNEVAGLLGVKPIKPSQYAVPSPLVEETKTIVEPVRKGQVIGEKNKTIIEPILTKIGQEKEQPLTASFDKSTFDNYNKTFEDYKRINKELGDIIKTEVSRNYVISGGVLSDLVDISSAYFSNPNYKKDNYFTNSAYKKAEEEYKKTPSYAFYTKVIQNSKSAFFEAKAKADKETERQSEVIAKSLGGWGSLVAEGGKADVDKIREGVDSFLEKNKIESDSPIAYKLRNELKAQAEFKQIEPEINEEFEAQYKKLYGTTPEEDIKKEYGVTVEKAKGIKAAKQELEKKRLLEDKALEAEFKPEYESLGSSYKAKTTEIDSQIENDSELNSFAQQLGQERQSRYQAMVDKGQMSVEQANAEMNSPASIEEEKKKILQKINEKYGKVYESAFAEYQKSLNEVGSRYKSAYRQQENARVDQANKKIELEIESLKEQFQISPALIEKRKKVYEDAYKKVSDSGLNAEIAAGRTLPFLAQSGMSLLMGLGGGLKGYGAEFDNKFLYDLGESLESDFKINVGESKEFSDWLDSSKLTVGTGNIIGRMLPGMGVTAAAAFLTKDWNLTLRLATTATTSFTAESSDMAGTIRDEVLQRTGDPAKADDAARDMWRSQLYLFPLYGLEGAPYISEFFTILGKKIAPKIFAETARGARKTLGQWAKETAVKTLMAGGGQVLEENTQEFLQNINEEAIRNGKEIKSIADQIDVYREGATLPKFKETIVMVSPSTLIMGATPVFVSSAYNKAKSSYYERSVDNYLNSASISTSLETSPEQYLFNINREKGKNFTGTLLNTLFTSGKISESEFDRLSEKMVNMEAYNEVVKKAKVKGNEIGNLVGYRLYDQYISATQAYESEKDEFAKEVLKKQADEAKAQFVNLLQGKGANVSVMTLSNGQEYAFLPDEMMFALQFPNIRESIKNGDIGVVVGGDKAVVGDLLKELESLEQEPQATQQPSQPIITKNTTPTDEKYGTIDRGDGKGVIDLTRAEYEAEVAKQQPTTTQQKPIPTEAVLVERQKEKRDAEIEEVQALRDDLGQEVELVNDIPVFIDDVIDRIDLGMMVAPEMLSDAIGELDKQFDKLQKYKNDPSRTHTTAQIDAMIDVLSAVKTEIQDYQLKQSENEQPTKTEPTTEAAPSVEPSQTIETNQVNPALNDVEGTAKALEDLEEKYGKRFKDEETYHLIQGSNGKYYIKHADRGKEIKTYNFENEEQAKKFAEKEGIELLTVAKNGVGFTAENKSKYDKAVESLLSKEQAPTALSGVESFETAKGSIYTVLPNGKTQRFKTATGEQNEPNDLIVFVKFKNPQQEQDFLSAQHRQFGQKLYVIDSEGNAYDTNEQVKGKDVRLAIVKDGKIVETVETSLEPKIGYNTFDQRRYTEKGESYRMTHLGNKVTKITPKAVESLLSKEQVPPALRDIESTAKALEDIDKTKWNEVSKLSPLKQGAYKERSDLHSAIAEAYHADKSAGKETELTKAVEQLLTPNTNQNEQKSSNVESEKGGNESLRNESPLNEGVQQAEGRQEENVTEQGGVTAPSPKTQPNETKTEQEKPLLEGVRNGGNETQGGQESTELRAETQVQEKVKATIADAVAKFYAIEGKGSQKREAAKAYRQTLEKMPTVKNIFDNIKPIFAQLEREGIITKSKECP